MRKNIKVSLTIVLALVIMTSGCAQAVTAEKDSIGSVKDLGNGLYMIYVNPSAINPEDQQLQYFGDNISKLVAKNRAQNMELILQTPHIVNGYTDAYFLVFKPIRII